MVVEILTGPDPERIRAARLEAELTPKQLARQLGCTLRAVLWWESGERVISSRYLPGLSRATGKPIEWFFA